MRRFSYWLLTALWFTAGMCCASGQADAGDWPQFRGPTGQGHAAARNLPLTWSDTENVAWKVAIPGQGWSSPVLHNGRLYLTAAVPVGMEQDGDFALTALCLDAKSGNTLWRTSVFEQDGADAPRIHQKNSHASPTPLVDRGQLFVHFGHQGVACLDLQGEVIWRNDSLRYPPTHGNGGSPALVDNLLVFSCDGAEDPFIVALDRNTGNVVWSVKRQTEAEKKFSFSTPLVITVQGKQQIITPGSNCVCALDPRDGSEIWRVNYDGYSVIPRPVFGRGMVYISTSYNRPSVMAIRPDGRGDVTDSHVAWSVDRQAPHTPSLLLVGDELYMVADKGVASCLDAHTGEVHWQERIGGNYSASPIHSEGKIYIQSEEGKGIVLRASTRFEELAVNDLGERTLASYAVDDGAIFIRSAEHLYRIESR